MADDVKGGRTKWAVEGFSQPAAVELKLDITDLTLLRWFVDFVGTGDMDTVKVGAKVFYWVNYRHVAECLPVLNISTERGIRKHLDNLCLRHVLQRHVVKIQRGTRCYFSFGPKYGRLVRPVSQGNSSTPVKSQGNASTPAQGNASTPQICTYKDQRKKDNNNTAAVVVPTPEAKMNGKTNGEQQLPADLLLLAEPVGLCEYDLVRLRGEGFSYDAIRLMMNEPSMGRATNPPGLARTILAAMRDPDWRPTSAVLPTAQRNPNAPPSEEQVDEWLRKAEAKLKQDQAYAR